VILNAAGIIAGYAACVVVRPYVSTPSTPPAE
jgi:hypothetical protein